MVNAAMVNAEPACLKQAGFCQKFPVSGRFPAFKTTVKYTGRFFVNAGTVHFCVLAAPLPRNNSCTFNVLTPYLSLQKGVSGTIRPIKERPALV